MKIKRLERWILALDLAWTPVAFALCYWLRYGSVWYPSAGVVASTYLPLLIAVLAAWSLLFSWMKLDGFRLGWYLPAIASQLIIGVCSLVLLVLAGSYLVRYYISRLLLGYFATVLFAGFMGIRHSVNKLLRSKYVESAVRRVLIVGNGPIAREVASKIGRHPEMLCHVVGFLCSEDAALERPALGCVRDGFTVPAVKVIGLLQERRIDEVIVTLSKMSSDVMNLAARCRIDGIRVSIVPHPYELYLTKPELVDVGGLPILQLHQASAAFADSVAKRFLDILLVVTLLPLALPLIVAGELAVSGSGGSIVRELR